ncbi:MAG TPA: class I SAM-dependent methyltransferase, partial [Longimicrobiaceae bacterium]|nr:class I SAM-dependent methyltransferase [Longimicrobiaceae bacterium]
MQAAFDRVVRTVATRLSPLLEARGAGLKLQLAGGRSAEFGRGEPITIVVNDKRGLAALGTFDAMTVGEAYLAGSIDVLGDMAKLLSLRDGFKEGWGPRALARVIRPLLFGQVASDRAWIAEHYDTDPDFFTLFLDDRHRCYSQAVFAGDDEPLEDAMTRKLDFAVDAVGAKPGDRVLDIGGGWGAFTEYGGRRGIRVTSLTISEPSERYIQARIDGDGLPCEVRREHLFEHRPAEPYDAIVNLGVTEHL